MSRLKTVRKWHLLLIWPATFSVLVYILSAFAHPLAGWVGPQAQHKTAPSIATSATSIMDIETIIAKHQLSTAKEAKLVPFKEKTLLQVTLTRFKVSRYFSIENHRELTNHSEQHAIWLAEHFVGSPLKINAIRFQNSFDSQYPSSNKRLPVYIIDYDTDDELRVIIHPQSMALISISNRWKRFFKQIFRNFHSFDWLNEFEAARLLLVSILLSLMLIMSVTGFYFLLIIKRKKTINKIDRRWHRRLAYPVVVPLFLFSVSGFHHLFQSSLYKPQISVPNNPALPLANWPQGPLTRINKHLKSINDVNGISLIKTDTPIYRMTLLNNPNKPFFMDAINGEIIESSDEDIIRENISSRLNINLNDIQGSVLIKRFGDGYSFKNKRLPVWRVDIESGQQFYIDPVNHEIIQSNTLLTRIESSSFSAFHMWGWLKPLIGHTGRDLVFTLILLISFILSIAGLTLYLSNKRKSEVIKVNLAGA
jgi:hypothetical protein